MNFNTEISNIILTSRERTRELALEINDAPDDTAKFTIEFDDGSRQIWDGRVVDGWKFESFGHQTIPSLFSHKKRLDLGEL